MITIRCPNCSKFYTIDPEHTKKTQAVCGRCAHRFSILDNVVPEIEQTPPQIPKRNWALPAAILGGALVVATAIVFYAFKISGHPDSANNLPLSSPAPKPVAVVTRIPVTVPPKSLPVTHQPVSRTDHDSASSSVIHTSLEDIVSKCEKSVCMISYDGGGGTGFVVDQSKGWIVTNFHVIESSALTDIVVTFLSGHAERERAEVVSCDPRNDLAILTTQSARSIRALPFANTTAVRKGQEVMVIGSPGLADTMVSTNSVTRGIVSNNRIAIEGRALIQIDAPINPGNSGGPLLDGKGKAIGVVTLKITNKEGMGFAVPIDKVRALMASPARTEDAEASLAEKQLTTAYGMMRIMHAKILDCFVDIEKHWKTAIAADEDMTEAVASAIRPYKSFLEKGSEQLSMVRDTFNTMRAIKGLDGAFVAAVDEYRQLLAEFFEFALHPVGSFKAFEEVWPAKLKRLRERRDAVENRKHR